MPYETVRYNREDLYEQVWSQPMSKLAKSYGLSDVGLAKICRKLKIPVPARGFWRRKLYGKTTLRPPLPKHEGPESFVVRLVKKENPSFDQEPKTEEESRIAFEQRDENRIRVGPRLVALHPHVKLTEAMLRKRTPDDSGVIRIWRSSCLDVSVSPAGMRRALRIMNALIKALEFRGFRVSIKETGGYSGRMTHATCVTLLGENIEFGLRECLDRKERDETNSDTEKYSWLDHYPKHYCVPSGRLSLIIKTYIGDGLRTSWTDGKKQRIEDCLNAFVTGLIKAAVARRAMNLEREKQERERQEQERLQIERERRRQEEKARVQDLINQSDAWHQSRQIHAYTEAVRQAAIRKHGQIAEGSQLDQWLAWANQQADRIDPLAERPSPDLNEKDEKDLDY